MSKHADALRQRLAAVAADIAGTMALPASLRAAADRAVREPDLVQALAAVGSVALELEALEETAKIRAANVRTVLCEVMSESGAAAIRLPGHSMSLVERGPALVIDDPALIPPTLMRERDPEPDRKAITAALKAGGEVPGCRLSNGGSHLRFANLKMKESA
jgi:hypothetical protein